MSREREPTQLTQEQVNKEAKFLFKIFKLFSPGLTYSNTANHHEMKLSPAGLGTWVDNGEVLLPEGIMKIEYSDKSPRYINKYEQRKRGNKLHMFVDKTLALFTSHERVIIQKSRNAYTIRYGIREQGSATGEDKWVNYENDMHAFVGANQMFKRLRSSLATSK